MTGPLGRYSEIVTSLITVFLIVAAVVAHSMGVEAEHLTLIDAAAFMALGAVFGKVSAANGYAAQARAAHKRLDSIGAPPANDGV